MVAIPTLIIFPALWNKRSIKNIDRNQENVNIAKQRIAEIDHFSKDDIQDNISDQEKQIAELELQATLLDDLQSENTAPLKSISSIWGLVIMISIPLLAAGFYQYLGSPNFVDSANLEMAQTDGQDINELLLDLESKLAENPENSESWALAAKTYMIIRNYPKAEAAYEKLNSLVPGNPDFLTGWADATVMVSGNLYTSSVRERIDRALAINPNQIDARWIASLGAKSVGDHELALSHLAVLKELVSADKNSLEQVNAMISRNQAQAGTQISPDTSIVESELDQLEGGRIIRIEVMLDPALALNSNGDDAVFVFAKAQTGPPMPLAVSKRQVKELPLSISLTEDMAMLPEMTIAGFDDLIITARISKSGNPIQQAGDLVSENILVTPENDGQVVNLTINAIAK